MDKLDALWLAGALGPGAVNGGVVLAAFAAGEDARPLMAPAQRARLAASRPADFAPQLETAQGMGLAVLGFWDEEYPEPLRHIATPPPVLYCQGRIELLDAELAIGMVGTRRPSTYGAEVVKAIGEGLAAAGAVIVSGLAAGLDATAHKAALAVEGPTVACIAFGHSHCYPRANRPLMEVIGRHGLVVGEYPPETEPEKPFFLQRNRLIAALSHGLLVSEARARSGTMSTVNFAAEYGREVFAVPGSIFSPLSAGTNALIREGAHVATCAGDVLEVYGYAAETPQPGPQAVPPALSPEAGRMAATLSAKPTGFATLCEKSGLGVSAAMAALTELELAGLCRQHAGRLYSAETTA